MTIEKRKLNFEVKRLIKDKFKNEIEDINVRIKLHSVWNIVVKTNIYIDWYVEDLQTGEIKHLGKLSQDRLERWLKESDFNRYRINWNLSNNVRLMEIENEIKDLVIANYEKYIGKYYDDIENKHKYMLIIQVLPK